MTPRRLSRRQFFSVTAATAGVVCVPLGCGSDTEDSFALGMRYFPQSVASGDPRENSVMLWTRLVDAEHLEEDLDLELEVSLLESFAEVLALDGQAASKLKALAAFDHCVSVRIDALSPATTYYYRFRYTGPDGLVVSRTGRTRTAPESDANAPVKFGVVCCQSYSGRYFHVLRQLATYDLDFVLHLGDYIYETGSKSAAGARSVVFEKPEEALERGDGLAARSLDNYRDLYKLYRSDRDLQALHERCAMIVIADDHEFSDDCHGATATYEDGRVDETDVARRAASDQAWFEYMPVDYTLSSTSKWQPALGFPEELKIYRSFVFGQHLELVLTDERRYRPDHLVPENALPGAIFADRAELVAEASVDELVPYVDIETYADGAYQQELVAHADALGLEAAAISGRISAPWLNEQLTAASSTLTPVDVSDAALARGYAYHQLLKSAQYSAIGSRYVLAEKPFHALAALRYRDSGGAAQNMLGVEQRAWFLDTFKRSTRTFKVWGSELGLLSRTLDLNGIAQLPAELQTRVVISGDDWDGFPDERRALLSELSALENTILLSGDLHCFFAATPFNPEAPDKRVVEFLTGSVSSTVWLDAITQQLQADPSVPPGVASVAAAVGALLKDPVKKPNPHLAFQELGSHGCSVISVDGTELLADFLFISSDDIKLKTLPAPLAKRVTSQSFRVKSGSATLEQKLVDGYYAWDVESASWVAS
ncbi:MAG: alkaline phosphatase D family protein [Polyangiaceae bacterium]